MFLFGCQTCQLSVLLHNVCERRRNGRVVSHKTLIEATEAKEAACIRNMHGLGPVANCQELLRLGSDAYRSHDEPAVLYFWLCPVTFVWSRKESLHAELVVHLTKGENVLAKVLV